MSPKPGRSNAAEALAQTLIFARICWPGLRRAAVFRTREAKSPEPAVAAELVNDSSSEIDRDDERYEAWKPGLGHSR
jgi:hypothetical protein